jgi:predicted TPR repeat methyltransferase
VDHAAIASAYDEIAERWLDGRFNQDNGLRQHAQALRFLESADGGWALNVGCGCNTRFNASMREHGMRIEGIDISARMVALAREADPGVLLHHADVCTWQAPRAYRFISAWDSIWHVALEEQRPLMLKLMHALESGGVFIFSAGGLDHADTHVDAAMGPAVGYSTLGIPGLLDVIAEAGCVCRHLEFDQHPEKHLVVDAQRIGGR